MIARAGLSALPPARRADLIYAEAQAAMSRQLWQAALGEVRGGSDDRGSVVAGTTIPRDATLDALIASLLPDERTSPPQVQAPASERGRGPDATPPFDMAGPVDGRGPRGAAPELGSNRRYAPVLAAAAERCGLPAGALAAIVDAEAAKGRDGSWQTYSRNPRSSAAGLGQFLSGTWQGLAETGGTWLNGMARAQGWLDDRGKVKGHARSALLATRYDATASIQGIADYARRNLDGLRRAGVRVDGTDAKATARLSYLGHHLGLGDAVQFLRKGGLGEARARTLLAAQVGRSDGERRVENAGSATVAHREWLLGYLDRHIRPDRFLSA